MKTWKEEVMVVCYEDNEKIAIEYQNGTIGVIERYMLKPATKADSAALRDIEEIK